MIYLSPFEMTFQGRDNDVLDTNADEENAPFTIYTIYLTFSIKHEL